MTPDGRRERQLGELRHLCRGGAVSRAIDLAFEHFACFGQDDSVVVLLEAAVERADVTPGIRRRLADLRAVHR